MDLFKQLKEAVSGNKLMEPIHQINKITKTVDSLKSLLKDSKVSQSVKDMINGLMTLIKTKPNIAGINHYFNHFLLKLDPDNQPPVLKELLEVYHERWKNVDRKTAKLAFEHIDFSEEVSILLHGNEKSIHSLFEALIVEEKKVKVYQTIGRPSEIGKLQAEKIAAIGYEVNFIEDNAIGQVLPEIDYVLIGCELILREDFVSDAGTHTLIASAKYYKRPIFLLADSRRILNTKYFPQNVLSNIIGEGKLPDKSIWKNSPENVKIDNYSKEHIPNYLITKFILEDGLYDPEEIKDQTDKVMVGKFF
ncbi:MAG: hypothetical protein R2753_12270 [Chitinophagales bacterium]